MSKIQNPVVLIHKRENSDTYAVAITNGSQNYLDAVLMTTMEPDMTGYADCWSRTGYYMAAEIERLKSELKATENNLLDSECHVAELGREKDELEKIVSVSNTTAGKPLTITLPDASSKAFWSGAGKSEVFHPDTYRRWVKEAIERDCTIAGIEVKVK